MATILPPVDGEGHDRATARPLAVTTTTPAAPLTSAGRTNGESRANVSACCGHRLRAAEHDRQARPRGAAVGRAARRPGRAPRPARRSRRRGRRRRTRRRPRAGGRGRRRAPGPAPCTRRRARLASCRAAAGDALDHRRDLLERHGEHVVQHERQPLGRRQRLQHHQQRQPDRVGQQRLVLRVDPSSRLTIGSGTCTSSGSSRRVSRERSMFRHTRATTVVSQPPRFSTLAGVGAAEPQPGVLDGVVGLADRAEHPVGHRAQVGRGAPRTAPPAIRARPPVTLPPFAVSYAVDPPRPMDSV